ncbi:seroin-like isoform X1 [Vanessa atalanta]|uniref:seroin-like isoform X1 n=1 Tax=Vanessa atalanta TaxID=42275 RepID=UPI001FCDA961|nr:seroin-like isoform X1 [Vanessa atalanta]
MALTILFITTFIAALANASFVWQDDNNPGSPNMKFFNNKFPKFPKFPNFPQLPPFPSIPPFHHFTFPPFPTIPPIVVLTPEDIAKNKGPNYNGVMVSSVSSSTLDKDGKVIHNNDATIITNNGGVVKKYTFGDNPSKVNIVPQPRIVVPKKPIWQPIIPILPLDPEVLKVYKPEKNVNFVGTSSVTFSHASDVNGVKNNAGGTKIITNVNGNVAEKMAAYRDNEV